jgi:hypothetical protein
MKKENCKIKLKWDYKGWEKLIKSDYNPYIQNDWDQTLLTKINQASAQIHMTTLRAPADSISINSNTLKLIEMLEYYDIKTSKISDRYLVIINDELLDNEIFVYNEKELNELCINIEILNYEKNN